MFRIFLASAMAAAAAAQTPAAIPQSSPAVTGTPAAAPNSSASNAVAAKDAVISIKGFCGVDADPNDPATIHTSECLTIVTRDQFEKLVNALSPGQAPSPEMQRKLAESYVQLMLFAAKAHQEGIEKNPNYQIIMDLVRIRTLSDFYTRELQQQFRNVSSAEIDAYYRQNQANYQELKVRKISIPRNAHPGDDQNAYAKKAVRVAQEIRERVVKGEDMADLQKEAYATLTLTDSPTMPMPLTLRPGMIPAESAQDVTAMEVGGVSKVELEPSAYVIYKLEAKQVLPLDQVKGDVISRLAQQKMDAKAKEIESSVHTSFNEQYFTPQIKGPVLENLH